MAAVAALEAEKVIRHIGIFCKTFPAALTAVSLASL
jgi:hypothetical protein